MTINHLFRAIAPSQEATIRTYDGHPAWERTLHEQYVQALLCNSFGNSFYADSNSLLDAATELHDKMLATDVPFMGKAIAYARQEGFMRSQPIYGLAKLASNRDYPDFERIFNATVRTPKDLSDFLVILKSLGRGQGGRRIKRATNEWLREKLTDYWAVKYGADRDNGGYSLRDILITTHPRGLNAAIANYLVRGTWDGADQGAIYWFEKLKAATSAAEKIEAITNGRLPHEVASAFAGQDKAIWSAIAQNMPIFALLRHLATLERIGVFDMPNMRPLVNGKLNDGEVISRSGIFPYQFAQAAEKVHAHWLKSALSGATELALVNVPALPGRTAVMLDVSGSMAPYATQSALFAVALMQAGGGSVYDDFRLFNTRVQVPDFNPRDSALTNVSKIRIGGGTDTGAVLRDIYERREQYDNLVLISDEQQNAGTPFFDTLTLYRNRVKEDARAFIINVSPHKPASAPVTDKNTFFLYGWSDRIARFMALAAGDFGSLVDVVSQYEV